MAQINHLDRLPMAICDDKRASFVTGLGARIAELRRCQDITQVQLARALSVSVESLIDENAPPTKRGTAPQIQQKIERLTRLPKAQQRLVLQVLDGGLAQVSR